MPDPKADTFGFDPPTPKKAPTLEQVMEAFDRAQQYYSVRSVTSPNSLRDYFEAEVATLFSAPTEGADEGKLEDRVGKEWRKFMNREAGEVFQDCMEALSHPVAEPSPPSIANAGREGECDIFGHTKSERDSYEQTAWIARQPHADCGGCQSLLAQLAAKDAELAGHEKELYDASIKIVRMTAEIAALREKLQDAKHELAHRADQYNEMRDELREKLAEAERLRAHMVRSLQRSHCGCVTKDCRIHGSYVPEEADYFMALLCEPHPEYKHDWPLIAPAPEPKAEKPERPDAAPMILASPVSHKFPAEWLVFLSFDKKCPWSDPRDQRRRFGSRDLIDVDRDLSDARALELYDADMQRVEQKKG